MDFTALELPGAYVIDITPHRDDRGFFARLFCEQEFADRQLVTRFPQDSLSYNARAGTVRGMHFQSAPAEETKVVRCTAGAVIDVLVDLRRDSPTYLGTVGVELTAANRRALYIPAGLAHGFQTLLPDSELHYMIDTPYVAAAARGVRWNDPSFRIEWPLPISVIADKDLQFPDWQR